MPFKRKSKKVFKKRSRRERSHRKRSRRERSRKNKTRRFSNKKRNTRKRMKKFTNKNMRGGVVLTRGQILQLQALGYTISLENGQYIVRGIPNVELINTRLPRALRKDDNFKDFDKYIQDLLNNSLVRTPDNIDELIFNYITGCDLEINKTAQIIMDNLLQKRQANAGEISPEIEAEIAAEIQNFQDRTKKLGSFKDTTDGLKELNGENGVKKVIFNELPVFDPEQLPDFDRSKRERDSGVLYKYVIIEENEDLKIYYSVAQGLYHFNYIDYYVKKHYNEDGTLRVDGSGERSPVTELFFVKNISIPTEIMFQMSFGNSQVKPEWFRLLRDFVLVNEEHEERGEPIESIQDFVNTHIRDRDPEDNPKYKNVLDALDNNANIIDKMNRLEDINAYRNYYDEWNTVIMGKEISHSCLTYKLGVIAAGEFCMDNKGSIYYVDCWSGHFKPPSDRIHVAATAFRGYRYDYLQIFVDHLAKSAKDTKCNNQASDVGSQLAHSVTYNSHAKKAFLGQTDKVI